MTRTIVMFIAVLWVLALALAIKLAYFPSAKDAYFAMDERSLQQAPANLVFIRPTHFSLAVFRRGVVYAPGLTSRIDPTRIMGRDVSLRDVIAVAWQLDSARVRMPAGAPTNNVDFIVTASQPRKRLQRAIRDAFGYSADKETVATDILAIKVEDPSLPGIVISGKGEHERSRYRNGRLYITHMRLKELTGGLEQALKIPVVDETGLTNYYDFSLEWDTQLFMRLRDPSTARPVLDKLLANWGLGLEPDTASLEMLVVKKAW